MSLLFKKRFILYLNFNMFIHGILKVYPFFLFFFHGISIFGGSYILYTTIKP